MKHMMKQLWEGPRTHRMKCKIETGNGPSNVMMYAMLLVSTNDYLKELAGQLTWGFKV